MRGKVVGAIDGKLGEKHVIDPSTGQHFFEKLKPSTGECQGPWTTSPRKESST